jgi:hypothetical protein
MKTKLILAATLIAMSATSAVALMGFKKDEWTNGSNKYCEYSNGVIITISIISLCPLSING